MDASTIAAWWGAIAGTLAIAWEIFRWFHSGPRLKLSASTNMQTVTPGLGIDETLRVLLNVRNVGDSATTITHFVGVAYANRFSRWRGKREKLFVVTTGPEAPVPFRLEPGATWSGMVIQSQVAAACSSKESEVFLGVQHATAEKPSLVRVFLPQQSG